MIHTQIAGTPDTYITQANSEWVTLAQQAYDYSILIKELEQKHKQVMDRLKQLSQGKTCHGGGFLLAKELRKGSIAYQDIPALAGVNLEAYRKADVEYWKLSKIA